MNINTNAIHYAAGFFDGEGCICLAKTKGRGGKISFATVITVNQRTPEPLQYIQENLGGIVERVKTSNGKPIWLLRFNKPAAIHFLTTVEPYLVCKRSQAQLILEYWELPRGWSERKEEIYNELKEAKRVWV